MNKKTLLMILVVPFIIALLGFSNVLIIKNFVEVDISDINFKYNDNEGFKLNSSSLLEATPVVADGLTLSEGNELMWYLDEESNKDGVASISKENDKYYLNALKEGEVRVICSNVKKTKSKSFNAIIYENGAIIINPEIKGSGYALSPLRNYGEYDISYNTSNLDNSSLKKNKASFSFSLKEYPSSSDSNNNNLGYVIENKSNLIDLSFSSNNTKLTVSLNSNDLIKDKEEVSFTLRSKLNEYIKTTYSFNLINDGVNVYNYLDLLMCTNKSSNGEKVVLQRSLESYDNTFNKDKSYKSNNVRLFGNESKLDFANEVYRFDSTYNTNFIKQVFNKVDQEDDIITGIRVQKDFYGNGYIINGKELVYPNNGVINEYSGKLEPGENDLFKGPKTFFSIGKFNAPIVKAFGQDNSLMYLDGNNITVDDLIIEGSDKFANKTGNDTTSNNMYNLEYCGSVIDVNGENNTIKNSELRNARTCLRVYSSPNFLLDNSLLSTAREFLMKVGNNEYKEIDLNKEVRMNALKKVFSGNLETFLSNHLDKNKPYYELSADELIKEVVFSKTSVNQEDYDQLIKLQSLLDTLSVNQNNETIFNQEITINNSYFYRSGIYSIALDTYFNGSFLYDGLPSFIINAFENLMPGMIIKPQNISGTMLPSKINVTGDTRFYDWKDVETIDASCLIEERLGEFISSIPNIGDSGISVDRIPIDSYFPMKSLILENAKKENYVYTLDKKDYINTPFAYYGGGNNLSIINYDPIYKDIGHNLEIDLLNNCIFNPNPDDIFGTLLSKCVPLAAGFNNFKFVTNGTLKEGTPYLFKEVPNKQDLKNRVTL